MIHLLLSMALFLAPTDPQLNEKSFPVCPCEIQTPEIQQTLDLMLEIAFGESKDRSRAVLVGLAAPQIGIQKRIILVDVGATGIFTEKTEPPPAQIQVFINPEILWKSEETETWREGCFSTDRICGIVPRSQKILLRAYDRNGNILTEEYAGYTARIFQHEIDHLDGIRFPDRIQNQSDLHWVEKAEIPAYRINWPQWEKKCPWERWEALKKTNY